jgi:hypothetical protein
LRVANMYSTHTYALQVLQQYDDDGDAKAIGGSWPSRAGAVIVVLHLPVNLPTDRHLGCYEPQSGGSG